MLEFAFEGQRYWDLLRQGVDYAASQIARHYVGCQRGKSRGCKHYSFEYYRQARFFSNSE